MGDLQIWWRPFVNNCNIWGFHDDDDSRRGLLSCDTCSNVLRCGVITHKIMTCQQFIFYSLEQNMILESPSSGLWHRVGFKSEGVFSTVLPNFGNVLSIRCHIPQYTTLVFTTLVTVFQNTSRMDMYYQPHGDWLALSITIIFYF